MLPRRELTLLEQTAESVERAGDGGASEADHGELGEVDHCGGEIDAKGCLRRDKDLLKARRLTRSLKIDGEQMR